jgi:hypothetical protein
LVNYTGAEHVSTILYNPSSNAMTHCPHSFSIANSEPGKLAATRGFASPRWFRWAFLFGVCLLLTGGCAGEKSSVEAPTAVNPQDQADLEESEPQNPIEAIDNQENRESAQPVLKPSDPSTESGVSNGSGNLIPADSTDPAPEYDPYNTRSPIEIAAEKAFAPPQEAKKLAEDGNIWVDVNKKRVIVDGYIAVNEGPLEMFACPVGTKEHESVVAVLSKASYVHAGLLAVGAVQGTTVSRLPEYRPATGQRIAIWVVWRDSEGQVKKTKAQQWVKNIVSGNALDLDWVFAGSRFWKDPESSIERYEADSGDLVCVSNFPTATLDLPVESSDANASLQFNAFTEHIPPRGTPVRVIFTPIPIPGDSGSPEEMPSAALGSFGEPEEALGLGQ